MMMKIIKTPVDAGDVKKLAYLLAEHDRANLAERSAVKVINHVDWLCGWVRLGEAWERKGKNNAEIIELLNKMVVQACKTDKANVLPESWLETVVRNLYWKLVVIAYGRPLNSENDQGWLGKIGGIISQTLNG